MASATSEKDVSDFHRYLINNPEMAQQIMTMLATLYNKPMKISQVQPYLRELYGVQMHPHGLEDKLRQENMDLYDQIFDLQDRVTQLEKELEEAKEENEGL